MPIPRDAGYSTRPSERSDTVLVLQIILSALRQNYDYPPVPFSGIYGPETVVAVTEFQRINSLPPTGVADRVTWHRLADEYNNLYRQ